MGCHNNNNNNNVGSANTGCVCEVVRAINDLQNESVNEDCLDCKDCFVEPLGNLAGPVRRNADTRVFTLTTREGNPFFAFFGPIHDSQHPCHDVCVSIFFRVEEVFDNCCARLRVLVPLDDERDPVDITDDCCIDLRKVCKVENFRATRSCVTVDLNCFCAVQCIKDVDLNICD
ncbi:CotY/CotZ family spore coat protein [Bacillus sp. REN10]|uniref:CotY/CotZ family spore coat protein n=1 Tax=Bacillus sp. REN10 TaxID=2782541 RepID=UPI00193AE9C7|nr:CotY/CotZ family spore coat protein [Bacillus sp. REN10]